jgi:hemoglobin/transferrin/lactoferrin receptor protein
MRKNRLLFVLLFLLALHTRGQEVTADTTKYIELEEVVFSANRWQQKINEVPNKVIKIDLRIAKIQNPQTSADLLGQTGTVFIQKSQLGGGSPMIRGFATNRVLLVTDGVRMNNAIYRSGNLQNIISIDPLALQNAEVIFGPGSLIYGSDAIGGVMDFRTLQPTLSYSGRVHFTGSALARYSTANKENTGHIDFNIGFKKFALLTSVSYSKFDDLKMGKNGGQARYLRPEYVERQGNADVIVPNSNPQIQRFSGYDQLNILQKLRFQATETLNFEYGFTYARTGEAPRYDRLIQYRNGNLRFGEWNYGPMLWRMHNLQVTHSSKNALYDRARFTVAYQDYEESRIDRTRNNNARHTQTEKVDAISFNWDATKQIGKGELFYGIEYVHNKVGSFGVETDISTGDEEPMVTRYPNGSKWSTAGIYGSYKINLHQKVTLTTGLRYSHNMLKAEFDDSFIPFPYEGAKLDDGALTGNLGLVYRPTDTWQLNGSFSTGYRMPNVDDIGKLFESSPGNLTIPNPGLKPEYAYNFEVGIIKNIPGKFRIELNGFHTILTDAIVRRPFTFNGQDSIEFDGEPSRVEALQNVAKATVWGFQASLQVYLAKNLTFLTHANWITGKETDDVNDEQVPLRHAPPFYGSSFLRYEWKKLFVEFSAMYNSEISYEDLAPVERAKLDIYAQDKDGHPYSPGWYTLNLKASYQLITNLRVTAGWENMTDQRYRPYSSGIVAAGSNFIVSLRATF